MRFKAWHVKAWHVTAVSALFAGAVLLHSGASFAQNKIGVAAAVKNQVTGNARPLVAGSDVRVREVVRTGADSMAQLLFLDETSLSIGPQSEVTLDRFVYDPNRRAGNVAFSTGRGVFRFVSGSQQPTSYQIKTPVATIGVRGTVVDWISQIGKTIFIQVQGIGDYKLPNGQVITLDPGQALIVHQDGKHELVQYESQIHAFPLHPEIPMQRKSRAGTAPPTWISSAPWARRRLRRTAAAVRWAVRLRRL